MNINKPLRTSANDAPVSGKLRYQKPAFRYEGVFETMALSCGKISGTQGACHSSVKTS